MPWPIPRSVSDAALLLAAQQWTSRLCDYGYAPRVGHLVAYRDERRRFPKRPKRKDQSRVVPIVWAGDITVAGFEHGRAHKLDRVDYFVEVSDPTHSSVIRAPSVVLQRLTSSDQSHRLIACAVPNEWQAKEGGFVAENHVIALVAKDATAGTTVSKELIVRRPFPEALANCMTDLELLGVKIFDFRISREDRNENETFHAKVVRIDDNECYVGSSNMTQWSFNYSLELGFLVRGEAGRRVSRILDAVLSVSDAVA